MDRTDPRTMLTLFYFLAGIPRVEVIYDAPTNRPIFMQHSSPDAVAGLGDVAGHRHVVIVVDFRHCLPRIVRVVLVK